MSIIFSLLSLFFLNLSTIYLVRVFRPKSLSEAIILFFLFVTTLISFQGYFASQANQLASLGYWCWISILMFFPIFIIHQACYWRNSGQNSQRNIYNLKFSPLLVKTNKTRFGILLLLIATAVFCGLANLSLVMFTAPYGHDALSYWIGRIPYFLQHGNMDYFEANQFWIFSRAKIQTILMTYSYLISDNNENLMQIFNYMGHMVNAILVYSLARILNLSFQQGLFSALIHFLLVEPLLLSVTSTNDVLLTTYIGIATVMVFSFKRSGQVKYLFLTALALAMGFNVNETFVAAFPMLSLIVCYALFPEKKPGGLNKWWFVKPYLKSGAVLTLFLSIWVVLIAFPSGYWENYKRFDNFIVAQGTQGKTQFFSLGETPREYIAAVLKNNLRYAVDFISLDGFPGKSPVVIKLQSLVKTSLEKFFEAINLDLATNFAASHGNYIKNKPPLADYGYSYWGVMGFLLVWPSIFIALWSYWRKKTIINQEFGILGIACLIFLFSHSMFGEYDVWRARYLTPIALLAGPL